LKLGLNAQLLDAFDAHFDLLDRDSFWIVKSLTRITLEINSLAYNNTLRTYDRHSVFIVRVLFLTAQNHFASPIVFQVLNGSIVSEIVATRKPSQIYLFDISRRVCYHEWRSKFRFGTVHVEKCAGGFVDTPILQRGDFSVYQVRHAGTVGANTRGQYRRQLNFKWVHVHACKH
jgi:hypothetical protein